MTGRRNLPDPALRVVHVSDTFAPRVGGIENQVADLAAHQAAQGWDVRVLTAAAAAPGSARAPWQRYRGTEFPGSGVRVHRLATPWTFGIPVHPRAGTLLARALELLSRGHPAGSVVVHIHAGVVSPVAWAALRVATRASLPTVVTWHSRLDGLTAPLRGVARLLGAHDPAARWVPTAVSPQAAAPVARMLGRTDVEIIPNAIDVDRWHAAAAQARRASGAPPPSTGPRAGEPLRLIATQRLTARKRGAALVGAVIAAHRRLGQTTTGAPRMQLTLVGQGPQFERIARQVRRAGAGRVVRLLGQVPRTDLPPCYARHDAFITLVDLEAFGIAALEARASGLPVLAPQRSGVWSFLTPGHDAVLLPAARHQPGRPESLAATIASLAARPAELQRLRAGSAEPPSIGTWERCLHGATAAYRRAGVNEIYLTGRGHWTPDLR